ncbi:enoyl-CoA hydratase-related protein [Streptomyces sp. AF1A]|uniref:enoyl-CoA hydratase-related protein n=1 Tax=Streptomyces sp. AF1A TaxID=3394350 RepID=UPI0039BC46EF
MTDEIRYELDGHVARVTIDRPHVLNALDEPAQERMNALFDEIERDPRVRVVVLTGAGEKAFCVGADMSTAGVDKTGVDYWADAQPNGFGGLALRETLDVPVIARVNGYALGGGMEMVLGCDIIVASETAQFGLTEPRVGRIALDGGVVRLPRQIPYHLAMGMLLTGRRMKAPQAEAVGLVNEVVPAERLDEAVDGWIADILACAPLSLRAVKHLVQNTTHMTPRQAQGQRSAALVRALRSKDSEEGVRAFQEKRPPAWKGE